MTDNGLIGRDREYKRLKQCMKSKQAQLIVVYGRRRVGKTFLVESFFENSFAFEFTGAFDQLKAVQLRNFADEMRFQTGREINMPQNWSDAFSELRLYLDTLPKEEKKVVFFDEMPWMDTHKSGFLPAFEWFWNSWGSKQKNLVFVVCGSATSWMKKNIADNKGGLFNRQTCRIYLEPFTLEETEKFLIAKDINWSRMEIAECYMIMGGMPYYLNLLDSEKTLGQNIDNLFFRKKAELWDEFTHLYHTLFANGEKYIEVSEVLSRKKSGLTRTELAECTTITSSNTLTKILDDLVASGFVRVYSFYGHKKRDALYQLCDYYSLFYFKFIKDNYGKDESFWSRSYDNPSVRAWYGLTFEQLCKDHMAQIKKALGISGVISEESSWYVKGNAEKNGAQIDLLIDRRDRAINICELKFSINEFEIDKTYDMNLRNKIEAFRQSTDCKKTLILTMITTYGVKTNKYSGLVNSSIVLDDLFEKV